MNEENLAVLQERYQESQMLEEQSNFITQQILELKDFEENLKQLSVTNEKEILASMGKGIYIKSELKDKELFVDVGAGILVKKNSEETQAIINQQLKRLGEIKLQLNERLEILAFEMQNYMKKLEVLE